MTPANLCQIFKRKHGIAEETAKRVCRLLGFNESETEYFCTLVKSEHAKSEKERLIAKHALDKMSNSKERSPLDPTILKLVGDWIHIAIIELTHKDKFLNKPHLIAELLGISESRASDAVKRLIQLNLVQVNGEFLEATFKKLTSTSDIPSMAIKEFHKGILHKAGEAINIQPVSKREYSANVLLIDGKKICEAKKMIRKFRRKLCDFLATSADSAEVYCLSTQFFSLEEKKDD